ncbi:unnamed protein product [Ixodes pacificus]
MERRVFCMMYEQCVWVLKRHTVGALQVDSGWEEPCNARVCGGQAVATGRRAQEPASGTSFGLPLGHEDMELPCSRLVDATQPATAVSRRARVFGAAGSPRRSPEELGPVREGPGPRGPGVPVHSGAQVQDARGAHLGLLPV